MYEIRDILNGKPKLPQVCLIWRFKSIQTQFALNYENVL